MLKTIEKALMLQEVGFLRFASADHLMQLAEAGREELFHRGAMIVRSGEPSPTFYILLDGRATLEGDGNVILEKAEVNLCSCLAGTVQPRSCVCLDECTTLAFDTSDLLDLLAGEPELSLALLKHFATNARQSP